MLLLLASGKCMLDILKVVYVTFPCVKFDWRDGGLFGVSSKFLAFAVA